MLNFNDDASGYMVTPNCDKTESSGRMDCDTKPDISWPDPLSKKTVAQLVEDSGLNALAETSLPEEIATAVSRFCEATNLMGPTLKGAAKSELYKKIKAVKIHSPGEYIKEAFQSANSKSREGQGQALKFNDPQPSEEIVNLADLLDEIVSTVNRYIVLPEGADTAIALWVLHVWCLDAFDLSPLLRIESPVKGCGKTNLLTVVGELLPKNYASANITTAIIYRLVDQCGVSLCIDETDQSLKNNKDLISLVNSGYNRKTAQVPRCVGDMSDPRSFSSYCGKVLSGIGKLPGTTESRSIKIHLKKKLKTEPVERLLAHKLENIFSPIKARCARIALDRTEDLRHSDPEIQKELSDRDSDNWRPLFSIADLAGGEWQDRARKAALLLSGETDGEDGLGVQLLKDIKDLFEERGKEQLLSDEVVNHLEKLEDRPWPDYHHGKAITATGIARLLKKFQISPKQFRENGGKRRGYIKNDFIDAWERYLCGTDGTTLKNKDLKDNSNGTESKTVRDGIDVNSLKVRNVPGVPDGNSALEHEKRQAEILSTRGLFEDTV